MKINQKTNQKDRDYIREKVIEFNMLNLPDELKTPKEEVCFVIEDEAGEVIGGVTGTMYWHHLHLDFLWIENEFRGKGYGSELLKQIEEVATENECRLIFLDTFSFQAPEFYKKNGYKVFGVMEDHPKGFNQYFLEKRLS
ncbi:GNAT family N-acetyltransferase [Gracilibacillus caseinilyticus]|uniref:GNAT family N-acetyltransferase n=1 Tax=Gracilibacillus caseinilyticus TaxID=2932256 RepID=A0ABY4EYC8_9BACI|nr:GNAT family N-acetyltransferase [Gracilibacillus caseinilyticus]UOQ49021.1 GNAT family N-acetyltransferase [Gracilibacillus caseinilyticus]